MDFDLKRSPRLMSKLLSGQQQTESGGVITAWDSSTLGELHVIVFCQSCPAL